jgi:hypothetical protein
LSPVRLDPGSGKKPGTEETRGSGPRTDDSTIDSSVLLSAQRALRSRFEDFRRALERRDAEAYRVALTDFHACLRRWTEAEDKALLPAVLRAKVPGRDPRRELRLEWVQMRELTRYLLEQVSTRAPLSDILGLADNLGRRLAAHETEMEGVYYPAAAPALTAAESAILQEAAPPA